MGGESGTHHFKGRQEVSLLASAIGAVDGNTLFTCIVCWERKCQGVNEILRSVKHQEDEILSVNVEK